MPINKTYSTFWLNRKVIVTGHTGFKGSWLTIWLKMLGANVCGISLPPATNVSLFDQTGIGSQVRNELVDIRNYGCVENIFCSFAPDVVIHMAAQPLVRESYRDPLETFDTNVIGTVNVLQASLKCQTVGCIVNVTTDKCYRNMEWCWGYREFDELGGIDPYSASKACSELVSVAYRESFLKNKNIGLATARAGNVIGGGDWSTDRLVPDILRSISAQRSIDLRYPSATRPWQHVLEPLAGYLKLAEVLYQDPSIFSEAWNFGPNQTDVRSVRWIAERLISKFGVSIEILESTADQPHEANSLMLDISKARQRLEWSPKWSVEAALDKIVNWQNALVDGQEMSSVCRDQIHEYLQN